MTKTRRYLIVAMAIIGAAVLIAVLNSRFGIDPNRIDSPLIDQPAPAAELPLLDHDGSVDLATLNGEFEIVVVNFFASWCLQCRLEHADLIATSDAYAARGVQFVGVSFQDDPAASIRFLDELGRGDTTIYTTDPGSLAAIEFGVFGLPETFFIEDGTIVAKLIGETNAVVLGETLESILAGDEVGAKVVGDQQQQPGQ